MTEDEMAHSAGPVEWRFRVKYLTMENELQLMVNVIKNHVDLNCGTRMMLDRFNMDSANLGKFLYCAKYIHMAGGPTRPFGHLLSQYRFVNDVRVTLFHQLYRFMEDVVIAKTGMTPQAFTNMMFGMTSKLSRYFTNNIYPRIPHSDRRSRDIRNLALVFSEAAEKRMKESFVYEQYKKEYCAIIDLNREFREAEGLVIILRGIPGSGKSTLAESIRLHYAQEVFTVEGGYDELLVGLVSADYLFDGIDGTYVFVAKRLEEAHNYCFDEFESLLGRNCKRVVIDNCNVKLEHYKRYEDAAIRMGYKVLIPHVYSGCEGHVRECVQRQTHGVPEETIRRYCYQMESDPREKRIWVKKR